MSSTIANGYGTGYTAPADSDPIWAHGTGFDPDLNTQVLTGEAAIQADTLDIAQNYVNADTANRERLVRAILGDAATKVAIDDLVAIETLIQNTLNEAFVKDSAHAPVFKVVDHGDVDQTDLPEGADDTFLSEGVEGAFITPEESGTDGGIILLSRDLLADPERLGEVALEELGEALVVHVQKDDTWDFVAEKYEGDDDVDFDVEDGDVGARIASTIQEERIEKHTWDDSDSDLTSVMWMGSKTDAIAAEAGDETKTDEQLAEEWGTSALDVQWARSVAASMLGAPWTATSFPDVENWDLAVAAYGIDGEMLEIQMAHALADEFVLPAETGVTPNKYTVGSVDTTVIPSAPATTAELDEYAGYALEWGVTAEEAVSAINISQEIFERRGVEFFGLDVNDESWGQFVKIYGDGSQIDVFGVARGIADGAIAVDESKGYYELNGVDLANVSDFALTDAIWSFVERDQGTERDHLSLDLLADGVAYATGDADGFTDTGDNYQVIQTYFADVHIPGELPIYDGPVLDVHEEGEAVGSNTRFSKEAVQLIWESDAFARTDDVAGNIDTTGGIVNFHVDAVAAATDVGVIGTGHTAYGVPRDAIDVQTFYEGADHNGTGHSIIGSVYRRQSDPGVQYFALQDADSGDLQVLQSFKVPDEGDVIHVFDSEGVETTINKSDLGFPTDVYSETELLHTGEAQTTQLETWVETNGHELVQGVASSEVSFVEYVDADTDAVMIRYVVPSYDKATDTMTISEPVSVEASSFVGKSILAASHYAVSADAELAELEGDLPVVMKMDFDESHIDPTTGYVSAGAFGLAAGASEAELGIMSGPVGWAFLAVAAIGTADLAIEDGQHRNRMRSKLHIIEATKGGSSGAEGGGAAGGTSDPVYMPVGQREPPVKKTKNDGPGGSGGGEPPDGTIQLEKPEDYVAFPYDAGQMLALLANTVIQVTAAARATGDALHTVRTAYLNLRTVRENPGAANYDTLLTEAYGAIWDATADMQGALQILDAVRTQAGEIDVTGLAERVTTWFNGYIASHGALNNRTTLEFERITRFLGQVRDFTTVVGGAGVTVGQYAGDLLQAPNEAAAITTMDQILGTLDTIPETLFGNALTPATLQVLWDGAQAVRANPRLFGDGRTVFPDTDADIANMPDAPPGGW